MARNSKEAAQRLRLTLLGASMLAGGCISAAAQAQDTSASPAATTQAENATPADQTGAVGNDIVVTGYRYSLQQSIAAKRDATSFTDSIFAEDIGKFPDSNIAESFNRIPGVTISRDITGEGVNVAIRGLGSNFTEVSLNGAPIAIASSGATDAQGTGREVDLSFFPTDLFTKLTVNKSYTADMLEGGAAGNVDIRSARPFDHPGTHFNYNFQGVKDDPASGWGQRGSFIASSTHGNFGILAGVSGEHLKSRVNGFETIGWTNPGLSTPQSLAQARGHPTPTAQDIADAQCRAGSSSCNNTGGGNWTIPGTVPPNAGNGLTPGDTINQDWLLAHNPGLTIQQVDNAIIPRLGRLSDEQGSRDRISAVVSAEWRPSDALHFYIDGMWGKKKNNLRRFDMDWVGRNGAIIPINETVDKSDCSGGCTATGGTFANAQFFLEYRPYIETTDFYTVNPGGTWQVADNLKIELNANYTKSTFHRESPSVLVNTPANSGLTVTYANDGGVPTIDSNVDLNDPANFVWTGGRVNIQDEFRVNKTKGIRGSVTWGGDDLNLKVGANYDDISRRISGADNSQAWQNAVCGDNPSVFLPSPNSQPPCQGLDSTGAAPAGYPTYPAYGGGPVTYGGSLIPQSALAGYLMPGPDGFVTVDWAKFAQDSNYKFYHDNEPSSGGTNTGASGGYIREKTPAAYAELNGVAHVGDNDLRFNVGVRYVHTDQTIAGQVSVTDPRNNTAAGVCPLPDKSLDGACFPNVTNIVTTHHGYDNWLPAANVAYNIGSHAVARFAVSRTMTRPDPNAQLPGVGFGSPSADVATVGNPALQPYLSTNIDFGFEYYTGNAGLVSIAAFRKELTGFTTTSITTEPFSFLAQYGITYNTLTPTQQVAIDSRGGPDAATIQVQQQVNASGKLTVNGMEFQWVQPLDFLTGRFGVHGLGFNANATIVDQKGSGAAPAVALGVAKYTYNVTGYYEHGGISLRLSDTFTKGSQVSGSGQNGINDAALFSDDYQQLDFSSSFDLHRIFGWSHAPELTFDVVNLTNAKLRQYFQFTNATFTEYKPGRQYMIGVRGSF